MSHSWLSFQIGNALRLRIDNSTQLGNNVVLGCHEPKVAESSNLRPANFTRERLPGVLGSVGK